MAIRRKNTSTDSQLELEIDNGDLAALGEVTKRLGFRNEESLLRFALAVLSQSATRSLTITDQNGTRVSLSPSTDLVGEEASKE